MDIRERLLDHFAKGKPGDQLHLRPDGDTDHFGAFFADHRQHQLPAHVPIHVHLLIVQARQDFTRYAGPIAQMTLHGVIHEGSGKIRGGDMPHDVTKHVQRPFEFIGFVEIVTAVDAFRFLGVRGQFHHVKSQGFLQAGFLIDLLFAQAFALFLRFECPELLDHARVDPDQEHVTEEQLVHFDVHVLLNDFMAVFPEDRRETRQRQIRSRGNPLRREEQHGLQLPTALCRGGRVIDVDEGRSHQTFANSSALSSGAMRNCRAGSLLVPKWAT